MSTVSALRAAVLPLLILAALSVNPPPVAAHGKAEGVVKERMELMERFEELIERMFAMAHGELPFSADLVRKAATEIRDNAGSHLVAMFPKGSLKEPSEARPEIWSDMESFTFYADRLADFAAGLAQNPGTAPSKSTALPKKWEDVPVMGQGMMGQGVMGQGVMGQGMMGRNMMGQGTFGSGMMGRGSYPGNEQDAFEIGLWHVAHACNSCHTQFRKEE